jgi:Fe-S-cluster containining protein
MADLCPETSIRVAGAEARVLVESDLVHLSCGTEGCSSNCCKAGAPIVLNPYEIARICRKTGKSYEDLLDIVDTERANGFPLVMLPREPVCHFWTDNGCSIYDARPLACRLFPIGRIFDGMQSRLVLPGRNICTGLRSSLDRTVADYLGSQEVSTFVRMADLWIEFVNQIEELPLSDRPVTSVSFHMLVYSPDTPPVPMTEQTDPNASIEERFAQRLKTALQKLPHFLH